jgi:hypothetical protein
MPVIQVGYHTDVVLSVKNLRDCLRHALEDDKPPAFLLYLELKEAGLETSLHHLIFWGDCR